MSQAEGQIAAENALLDRLRQGDATAYETLVRSHRWAGIAGAGVLARAGGFAGH